MLIFGAARVRLLTLGGSWRVIYTRQGTGTGHTRQQCVYFSGRAADVLDSSLGRYFVRKVGYSPTVFHAGGPNTDGEDDRTYLSCPRN